jgi:hypothetical protein
MQSLGKEWQQMKYGMQSKNMFDQLLIALI